MPTGVRSILRPTLGQLWLFLAVALPALAALLVPMPAVDLAYQLRAGAGILAGEGIPTVDTWTFTVAGTPWLDQQWGAQVLLAWVYHLGSWTGLAILRAALVAVTFGFLLAAIRLAWSTASVRAGGSATASSARTAALVTLGAFVVAAPALALRPQLFAIALFAATLVILADRSRHPRRLWLIPVIAIAWANVHGSFPLVVVLVGLAWLDELALARTPLPAGHARPKLSERLRGSTGLALVAAVAAFATLVTPVGTDGWRYVATLARNPEITSRVSEWRPPSPLDPAGAIFYLSLALAILVVGLRIRADPRRLPERAIAPIATIAVFGTLGVITGRGLAWWALAAPVALVVLLPGPALFRGRTLAGRTVPGVTKAAGPAVRDATGREARRSPLNALVAGVLILAAVALLPAWRPLGPAGVPLATLTQAPQGIAAELLTLVDRGLLPPGGRVSNPQTWGSWLEWAAPNLTYALDSRIEIFYTALWLCVERAEAGELKFGPDALSADAVVVAANERALESALRASPRWERVYADAEGSVWLRTNVATRGPAIYCGPGV